MKTPEITKRLKPLLRDNPTYRDSYPELYANFIGDILAEEKKTDITAIELLGLMAEKKIPDVTSIARISRMIQADNPKLYGGIRRLNMMKQEKAKKDLGY